MSALIVERLWRASWQAGLLVLAVLLLQWLLARWLTPAWRHRLWWLVLLRLALPVLPESSLSAFNWLAPRPLPIVAPAVTLALFVPAVPAIAPPPLVANSLPLVNAAPVSAVNSAPAPEKSAAPVRSPVPWQTWIVLVWLGGAGGLALRLVWQWLRFRHQLRHESLPVAPEILAAAADARQALGVRRPVAIRATALIRSPAVCGLWRPCLLVPADLASGFDAAELRHLLLHEFAHIRRGDLLENALATALQMAHWFNPLAWLAFARLRTDRELACDARALAAAREADPRAYGRSLLKWVERCAAPAAHPGLVGLLEDPGQMRRRFRQIAQASRARRWPALAGVLFVAVGVLALTDAQSPQPVKPLAQPPATLEEALAQVDQENRTIAVLTNEIYKLGQAGRKLFQQGKLDQGQRKFQEGLEIKRRLEDLREQYDQRRQVVVLFTNNPILRSNAPDVHTLLRTPKSDSSVSDKFPSLRKWGLTQNNAGMAAFASSEIVGLEVALPIEPQLINEKEEADLLRRLLASKAGITSLSVIWANLRFGPPSIVARVTHRDRSAGLWLLWPIPYYHDIGADRFLVGAPQNINSGQRLPYRFCSAYQDEKGVWWYSDLSDDQHLERDFASPDSAVRLSAAKEAFVQFGMFRYVLPSLLKMLKHDPDVKIRRYLAYAFGEQEYLGSMCGEALEESLRQNDVEVRQNAAASLGKIKFEMYRPTPALLSVLNDPVPEVRQAAAESLRQIAARTRDTNTMPELVAAAKASDPQVRTVAQSILQTLDTNAPPSAPPSTPSNAPPSPEGPVSKAAPIEPASAYFPLVTESISLNLPNCQRGLENVLGLSLDSLDETAATRAQEDLRNFFTAATGVDFRHATQVSRSGNSVEMLSRRLLFDLPKKQLILCALPEEIAQVRSVLARFGTAAQVILQAELLQVPAESVVVTGMTPEENQTLASLASTKGPPAPLLSLSSAQSRALQQVLLRRPGAQIVGQATLAQASNWRTQVTINKMDPDADSPLDALKQDYALRLLPVVRSNGCLAMLEMDVFHTPPGQTDSVHILHAPTNIAFFEGQTLMLSRPWPKEMPIPSAHESNQYYLFVTAQSLGESPRAGELEPAPLRPETIPAASPDAKPSKDSVNKLVQAGRQLLEAGRLDEAKAKLEQALKADPKSVSAKYYLNLVSETQAKQKNRAAQPEVIQSPMHPPLPPTNYTPRQPPNYKVLRIDPTALLDWAREHHPEQNLPDAQQKDYDEQMVALARKFMAETVGDCEAVENIDFLSSGLPKGNETTAPTPSTRIDDQAVNPRFSFYLKWEDWGGESSAVPYGTKSKVPIHLRPHVGLLLARATPEQLAKLEKALAELHVHRQIQLRVTWIDEGTASSWSARRSRSFSFGYLYDLPKGCLTMDVFGWSVPEKPRVVWYHDGTAAESQAWFRFVLTPEQANETVLHFKEAAGAKVLEAPPVIARNGQSVPILVDPAGALGKFQVRPTLAPDGYAIELAVEAELPYKSAPGDKGKLPQFSTRLAVWDSQSAVLACALPGAIGAGETKPEFKPRRYMFITARVVNQDGQPLRSDDGLPTRVLFSAPPQ